MEAIIITPKNEREYSFVMELLGKLKIKAKPVAEKPLRPMTMAEYNAEIDRALDDARNGRVISHEEMKNKKKGW